MTKIQLRNQGKKGNVVYGKINIPFYFFFPFILDDNQCLNIEDKLT